MTHRYPILYKVEHRPEGVTADEARAEGHGATEGLVIGSILFGTSGSGQSYMTVTLDGRTGKDLDPDELFKWWTQLARSLTECLPPGSRRDLCGAVFETVRTAVLAARDPS